MTSELKYLACTALLTALLWIPYVVCQVQTNGFLKPENYKDPTVRPMPLWGHRAHRAYLNSVETLAPFAVLVIIAELEGKTGAMTAVPPDGVYAGRLRRLDTGETYPAAISVGTNPTFDGVRERRVESYVLDRTDLDLYGVEVEVSFVERLRGMVAFESVEKLVDQMTADVDRARELLT